MRALMWTADLCEAKHQVAETLRAGPDLSVLNGRPLALLIDPALLQRSTDMHTLLTTLMQAVLSTKDSPAVIEAASRAAKEN